MANVEKISIALTPEMNTFVREAVQTGDYASASEVMREALRDWRQRRTERAHAIGELGRLWDEGISSGPSVDGREALDRIRAEVQAL
jgi:antitoxin ParD1/3/4